MKVGGSTSLNTQALASRWGYPQSVPTFDRIDVDRVLSRPDQARPLASAEMPAPVDAGQDWPRVDRVTSDDPAAVFADASSIDALVVNLLDPESDPALQLCWAMANTEKLGDAINAICAERSIARAVIAVFGNAPAGWRGTLRALASGRSASTKLVEVPPRYPVAFAQLLRRQLRFKHRQRIVTLDAVALVDIGHARRERTASSLVPVAVRAGSTTHYHTVARGTRLSRVLTALHVDSVLQAVVAGPTLRGVCVDRSVELGAGELAFHVVPEATQRDPVACIRCGWCAEVCPAALAPIELFDAALRRDDAALTRGHVRACVDCGLCTAICPSQITLHDAFAPRRHPAGGASR